MFIRLVVHLHCQMFYFKFLPNEICKILCKRILIKTKISNYVCMSETRYWNNLLTSSILKVKRLEIQMIQKPLGARKAMGLKRISIHSSKRHPLAWLSQITVRFKGIQICASDLCPFSISQIASNSKIYGHFSLFQILIQRRNQRMP
jgi:hypothetical protein